MSLRLEQGKEVVGCMQLDEGGMPVRGDGFKRGQLLLGRRLGTFAKLHLKLW